MMSHFSHEDYWIPKLVCSDEKAECFLLPQMEVKEVEEEQNSYKDFKNHQNAAFSTRSSPSRTNKVNKTFVYTLVMPSQHRSWILKKKNLTLCLLYCALILLDCNVVNLNTMPFNRSQNIPQVWKSQETSNPTAMERAGTSH